MTSIASVNSAALLILQQAGPTANSSQLVGRETDILKIANGASTVSSESTRASSQAAAAAGKVALDAAESEEGITSIAEFKKSDLYAALVAGELAPPSGADRPDAPSEEETTKRVDAMNTFLVANGREPLHESIRSSIIKNRAI